jgi:hypothetical protein
LMCTGDSVFWIINVRKMFGDVEMIMSWKNMSQNFLYRKTRGAPLKPIKVPEMVVVKGSGGFG